MFPHSRTSCRVHKVGLFIAEGITRYRKLRGYLRFSKTASYLIAPSYTTYVKDKGLHSGLKHLRKEKCCTISAVALQI